MKQLDGLTPSSAVNFLRSNSANAPGPPSGIMKTSWPYCLSVASRI